jgi:4-amino-4-deoxy-L-arabinose transferase-like glycosyltransferase
MEIQTRAREPRAKKTSAATAAPANSVSGLWRDRSLWLIALLAGLLLFWNLDGRCLWEDEAETALLGRSILRSGLPYAWDGANLVSQEESREFGSDYLWRWSPWVQFYLAAGSMGLFGDSTVAARLLFAILGLSTVPLTYVLALRLFGSPVVARLSAFFLAVSVPFLLHARQCRWYAPSYVLTACLLLAFIDMDKGKYKAQIGFVVSALLLWHTNFHAALGLLFALALGAPIFRPERNFLVRVGIALLVAGLLILPSYFFFTSFRVAREMTQLSKCFTHFAQYAGEYFSFMLPMPVLAILVYWLATRRPAVALVLEWRRGALFLLTICLGVVVYLSFGPWHFFRYMSVLLPVTSVLMALGIFLIINMRLWLGIVAICTLLFTDILHLLPLGLLDAPGTKSKSHLVAAAGPFGFPIVCYLGELTRRIDDPEFIVAQYLNSHARADDVVLVSYGELPLQFYTNLKIRGGISGLPIPDDPDWFFLRHKVMSMVPGKDGDVVRFLQEKLTVKKQLNGHEVYELKENYRAVDLPGKDFHLGNCPEPSTHDFDVPADAPGMLLLQKRPEQKASLR